MIELLKNVEAKIINEKNMREEAGRRMRGHSIYYDIDAQRPKSSKKASRWSFMRRKSSFNISHRFTNLGNHSYNKGVQDVLDPEDFSPKKRAIQKYGFNMGSYNDNEVSEIQEEEDEENDDQLGSPNRDPFSQTIQTEGPEILEVSEEVDID
jgi:hypothetical protein